MQAISNASEEGEITQVGFFQTQVGCILSLVMRKPTNLTSYGSRSLFFPHEMGVGVVDCSQGVVECFGFTDAVVSATGACTRTVCQYLILTALTLWLAG